MSPRLSPRTDDRGTTAVEYALIAFLVAIAMLIGVVLVTRSLSSAFAASADSAAGPTSTPSQTSSAPTQSGDDDEDDHGDGHDDGDDDDEGNGNDIAAKPGAPTGVTAVRSDNGEITVSWTAPSTSGSSAITGYTVEFETESQVSTCDSSVTGWNNGSAGVGASANAAAKSGLGSDWYCVRIFASNGVTSGPTNFAYAGPVYSGASKPGAPTAVTAARTANGVVTVSWTAPHDNGGADITSYPIGYESDDITGSSTCDANSGDYTDETDTGASTDTSEAESGLGSDWYCVRVSAANGATSGSNNYAYAGPVYSGASLPGAPTNVTAVRSGNGEVTVSWTAPADNGGSAVTDYPIGYEDDGVTSSSVCSSSSGNYTDETDSGSASDTSEKENGLGSDWYCVRIAADNDASGALNYAYAGPVYSG